MKPGYYVIRKEDLAEIDGPRDWASQAAEFRSNYEDHNSLILVRIDETGEMWQVNRYGDIVYQNPIAKV